MHEKEKVLQPILERELGVKCLTPKNLNTDSLGTFSGEIERINSPLETAKQKCLMAMNLSDCDLAVSSEGSFGPHPIYAFIPYNEELLFLYDKKNNLEIVVKEISTSTNFMSEEVRNVDELKQFAEKCLFPSHALIIKNENNKAIEKGINNWEKLYATFQIAQQNGSIVKVETDMRAHFNPTRMSVIEQCGIKLIEAIQSTCPSCNTPGFIVKKTEAGLPCETCNSPTRSTLKHVYVCSKCSTAKEEMYPNNKRYEDPMYCDFCNP
jgi:hypothetical protein